MTEPALLNTFHLEAHARGPGIMAKCYILCKLCYENTTTEYTGGESVIFAGDIFANVLKYGRIVYVGLPSLGSNSQDCPGTLNRLVTRAGGETEPAASCQG